MWSDYGKGPSAVYAIIARSAAVRLLRHASQSLFDDCIGQERWLSEPDAFSVQPVEPGDLAKLPALITGNGNMHCVSVDAPLLTERRGLYALPSGS